VTRAAADVQRRRETLTVVIHVMVVKVSSGFLLPVLSKD